MSSQFLLQNLSDLISLSSTKNGGSMNNIYNNKQNNFLFMLIGFMILILIKGLIVYYSYNFVVPKVIYSLSENKTLETIDEVVNELKQNLSQSIQSYSVFCWKEAIILPSSVLVSGWDKGETMEAIIKNYKETEYFKQSQKAIK